MEREDYFFDEWEETSRDKVFVLIIYDIIENKKRVKFAKFLQGYGKRVQKSAFEARLSRKKYEKLIKLIPGYVSEEDSIRVYRISGKGQVMAWGLKEDYEQEDIILV